MENKELSSGNRGWLAALKRKLSKKFKKSRQKCENSPSLDSILDENNESFATEVHFNNSTSNNNEIESNSSPIHSVSSRAYEPPSSRELGVFDVVDIGSSLNEVSIVAARQDPSVSSRECEEMKKELSKLPCYWPSLTRVEAQKLLSNQQNGSFLVRDSSEKESFTLSFRTNSKTFHCRNQWSEILASKNDSNHSVIDIIEDSIKKSQSSVVGFVKCDQNDVSFPAYAVRLIFPINRKITVPSLQALCLNKIKSKVNQSNINSLPLPPKIKDYVRDNYNTL